MLPFAVFYLMLAALAVVVWVQLRRDDFDGRSVKQLSRHPNQTAVAASTSTRNAADDRKRHP
jgi:hypothetical protein